MRGLKSKRLEEAVSMISHLDGPIYDLYCDHGKVGESFLSDRMVFFNDIQDNLLNQIKERTSLSSENFLSGPAQDLTFLPNSIIFMMGVGGHLMIECFEKWFSEKRENLICGQKFLVSAHYYLAELGEVLAGLDAYCLKKSFIWEGGRGYEHFLISFDQNLGEKFKTFDEKFWGKAIVDYPNALTYLKQRLSFADSYQGGDAAMKAYCENLRSFLEKNP